MARVCAICKRAESRCQVPNPHSNANIGLHLWLTEHGRHPHVDTVAVTQWHLELAVVVDRDMGVFGLLSRVAETRFESVLWAAWAWRFHVRGYFQIEDAFASGGSLFAFIHSRFGDQAQHMTLEEVFRYIWMARFRTDPVPPLVIEPPLLRLHQRALALYAQLDQQ